MIPAKKVYPYQEVVDTVNRAADDLIGALEPAVLPETGVRDAINATVNVALEYLANPDVSLDEAIGRAYAGRPTGEIVEWCLS